MHQKITRFLWFDGNAGPGPKGSVMSVTFELDGQEFYALNGGPHFQLHARRLVLRELHDASRAGLFLGQALGGRTKKQPCGWLQDKYGLSWQIIPTTLGEKIEIEALRQAYEGG